MEMLALDDDDIAVVFVLSVGNAFDVVGTASVDSSTVDVDMLLIMDDQFTYTSRIDFAWQSRLRVVNQ